MITPTFYEMSPNTPTFYTYKHASYISWSDLNDVDINDWKDLADWGIYSWKDLAGKILFITRYFELTPSSPTFYEVS